MAKDMQPCFFSILYIVCLIVNYTIIPSDMTVCVTELDK